MYKLLSDSANTEISNKVMDILRPCHISNCHSEAYHQNQNPAEWRYRTIKSWTNTVMNRSGAPANCWLFCLIYVCCLGHFFHILKRMGRGIDKVTRKVVEIIDQENGHRVENINFILDIGNGKVEELISYNQLLEHLENTQDNDIGMDQELFKFRSSLDTKVLWLHQIQIGKECSSGMRDLGDHI